MCECVRWEYMNGTSQQVGKCYEFEKLLWQKIKPKNWYGGINLKLIVVTWIEG